MKPTSSVGRNHNNTCCLGFTHGVCDLGMYINVSEPATRYHTLVIITGVHCLDADIEAGSLPNGDTPHDTVDVAEHAQYLAAYSLLIKAPLCFTSAATGAGVAELFQRIAHDCGASIPLGKECEAQAGAYTCMSDSYIRAQCKFVFVLGVQRCYV